MAVGFNTAQSKGDNITILNSNIFLYQYIFVKSHNIRTIDDNITIQYDDIINMYSVL